jgi:hypothetical protein
MKITKINTSFSYTPIKIQKQNYNNKERKFSEFYMIKNFDDKVEKEEKELFSSPILLESKIEKLKKSINILSNKINEIKIEEKNQKNICYEISLTEKISNFKMKLFRCENRLQFLNNNQDIIPFL